MKWQVVREGRNKPLEVTLGEVLKGLTVTVPTTTSTRVEKEKEAANDRRLRRELREVFGE